MSIRFQLSWLKTCLELLTGGVLALLLYLVTMNAAVGRLLFFSLDAKRIIEISRFCTAQGNSSENQAIFILGSSIVFEGIDADFVDKTLAKGMSAYNLGVAGLTPVEALLLEPAIETGKPKMVVIGVDAMSLGMDDSRTTEQIDFEKLQAYRATNSMTRMDQQLKNELVEQILLPDEKEVIASSYLSYLINCRSLPIFFTESKLRELARQGLRTEGFATNFKSPWMLKASVNGSPKERLVNTLIEKTQRLNFAETNRNVKALRVLSRTLHAKNIALLVVLWPIHPRVLGSYSPELITRTNATLEEIARENAGVYLNYSSLLEEGEFADALHPNSEGRARLSSQLAGSLKKQQEESKRNFTVGW